VVVAVEELVVQDLSGEEMVPMVAVLVVQTNLVPQQIPVVAVEVMAAVAEPAVLADLELLF